MAAPSPRRQVYDETGRAFIQFLDEEGQVLGSAQAEIDWMHERFIMLRDAHGREIGRVPYQAGWEDVLELPAVADTPLFDESLFRESDEALDWVEGQKEKAAAPLTGEPLPWFMTLPTYGYLIAALIFFVALSGGVFWWRSAYEVAPKVPDSTVVVAPVATPEAEIVAPVIKPAPPPAPRYPLAKIDSPDGYAIVYDSPSRRGVRVAEVPEGERFEVLSKKGSWWKVRTRGGKSGFMHQSMIKLL